MPVILSDSNNNANRPEPFDWRGLGILLIQAALWFAVCWLCWPDY